MQKKKKPARRTGASKKRKPKSIGATMTVGGQRFSKIVCSLPKTEAKKRAENVRKGGHKARVIKQGKTYCVFKGAKRA